MGPKFSPPRKTSLPSYSRKLRWTLIGFHLSPHPDTDSYQTFTTGPFPLLTWLHQAFCSFFVPSHQGHALEILCPKRGGHMGPSSLLIQTTQSHHTGWPPCLQALGTTTLLIPEAPKLTWNTPLNVCSPHSFKDLLSHQAFLSLPAAQLQILHTHLLDPSVSLVP